MASEFVDAITTLGAGLTPHLVNVGDRFRLRDVDGGEPTGDYVVTHIRIDTSYTVSLLGNRIPRKRVYIGTNLGHSYPSYTRDLNCVFGLTDKEREYEQTC
jgi:hypothetical protein